MEKEFVKKLLTLPSYKVAYIQPDLDENFEFRVTDTKKILEWMETANKIFFAEREFVRVLSLLQGNGTYYQILIP